MPNYDKEQTRINAIKMLTLLAMDEGPFASPSEEIMHLTGKSSDLSSASQYAASHLLEFSNQDQLLLIRLTSLLMEVQYTIAKKYGFEEDENESSD
jgi:hypothetical protein